MTRLLANASAKMAHRIMRARGDFRGKHRLVRSLAALSRGAPIRSVYGPLMEAQLHDLTNYFAVAGYPDDIVASEVLQLKAGDAFIDIGANAGLFSLLAKDRVKQDGVVVAFEPQWPLAHSIRRNAALNRLRDIHVFPFALGTATASARLASSSEHSGAGHIESSGNQDVLIANPREFLPLLKSLIGARATMIKIDVEGAEATVVEAIGPLLDELNVLKCIIEIDSRNLARFGDGADGIYDQMQAAGFRPRFGLTQALHYDEIFERKPWLG